MSVTGIPSWSRVEWTSAAGLRGDADNCVVGLAYQKRARLLERSSADANTLVSESSDSDLIGRPRRCDTTCDGF